MKKIIVSIFVIGLLLNTAPLCMGREEAVDGASFDVRESFRHVTRDDFAYLDSGKLYDGIDEEIVGLLPTPPKPIRSIAEFEPMQGVLISYPGHGWDFGISYDIIAEMAEDVEVVTIVATPSKKNYVKSQYLSHGVNLDHCSFLIAPTTTFYTRDYNPWFIFSGNDEQSVVNFRYRIPLQLFFDDAIPRKYARDQDLPLYRMPFLAHDGGNYMTDGHGTAVSVPYVWRRNPLLRHSTIEQILHDYLGIHTYYVHYVHQTDIFHIDLIAKFLAPDVVMIEEVPPDHYFYDDIEALVDYFESQISCYGTSYEIVRVRGEGYTNSLILNNKVFVPLSGSEWDDEAIATYEAAMQGYEILGFSHDDFSWADAIHCRTKGIPDRYMLYIEHVPLWEKQIYTDDGFEVQAKIFPYSGESLIADSTLLYWRVKGEEWNTLQMQSIGDDYYSATIPPQNLDVTIEYYIHAEDESCRSENHPYIGAPMAHNFTVNNPPEKPSIDGPANGKPGNEYTYTASTVDPDDDQVYYWFNWGDGSNSSWLGPYNSGQTGSASHTWAEKGSYEIWVKARDIYGHESEWSDPLAVIMPRNKPLNFNVNLLERLFERFPNAFPILRHLLGLI